MTRFQNEIDAEIEGINSRLEALYAARADAPVFPKEPKDGSLIKFHVQHDYFGPTYRYAAYRIGARWYLTGTMHTSRPLTWRGVVDLMRKDVSVRDGGRKLSFQVADKWKTVQ